MCLKKDPLNLVVDHNLHSFSPLKIFNGTSKSVDPAGPATPTWAMKSQRPFRLAGGCRPTNSSWAWTMGWRPVEGGNHRILWRNGTVHTWFGWWKSAGEILIEAFKPSNSNDYENQQRPHVNSRNSQHLLAMSIPNQSPFFFGGGKNTSSENTLSSPKTVREVNGAYSHQTLILKQQISAWLPTTISWFPWNQLSLPPKNLNLVVPPKKLPFHLVGGPLPSQKAPKN